MCHLECYVTCVHKHIQLLAWSSNTADSDPWVHGDSAAMPKSCGVHLGCHFFAADFNLCRHHTKLRRLLIQLWLRRWPQQLDLDHRNHLAGCRSNNKDLVGKHTFSCVLLERLVSLHSNDSFDELESTSSIRASRRFHDDYN